jgi:thiamine kinase
LDGDPHEARVRALLRAHPDGPRLAEAPFVAVGGGAFNRCWRADTAEGPRFVRLAGQEACRLGADWDSELALLRIASRSGLAPAPLLAVPGVGLLVTEYIQRRAPVEAATAKPAQLRQVGALLRAVHGLASAGGIRLLDFATQAGTLEVELGRDPAPDARLRARAARVFARLHADRGDAVPCHNDVHDANVLDDGRRLRLVDWEYGGLGDPVFDVAGFASHHALGEEEIGLLLDGYGSGLDRARLREACWGYDYVQWLWHRVAARVAGARGAASRAAAEPLAVRLADGD